MHQRGSVCLHDTYPPQVSYVYRKNVVLESHRAAAMRASIAEPGSLENAFDRPPSSGELLPDLSNIDPSPIADLIASLVPRGQILGYEIRPYFESALPSTCARLKYSGTSPTGHPQFGQNLGLSQASPLGRACTLAACRHAEHEKTSWRPRSFLTSGGSTSLRSYASGWPSGRMDSIASTISQYAGHPISPVALSPSATSSAPAQGSVRGAHSPPPRPARKLAHDLHAGRTASSAAMPGHAPWRGL